MIIYNKSAVIRDFFSESWLEIRDELDLRSCIFKTKLIISEKTEIRIKQALESLNCSVFIVNSLTPIFDGTIKANKNLPLNFYSMWVLTQDDMFNLSKKEFGIKMDSTNIMRYYLPLKNPYHLYNY